MSTAIWVWKERQWEAFGSSAFSGWLLCFGSLFPVLILALRRSVWSFWGLLTASVALGSLFAYSWLTPNQTLSEQWNLYVHPGSHLFYFVAGVGISWFLAHDRFLSQSSGYLVITGLTLTYVLLPRGPLPVDNIAIVTGWRWGAYSLVCIALVWAVSLTPMHLPGRLHISLAWLGRVSYSIYLLHPIVYTYTGAILRKTDLESVPTALVPFRFLCSLPTRHSGSRPQGLTICDPGIFSSCGMLGLPCRCSSR